jgi:hypothetical protein
LVTGKLNPGRVSRDGVDALAGSMRGGGVHRGRDPQAGSMRGHGEVARGRGAGGATSLGGCLHARAWAGEGGSGTVKPWWTPSLGSYKIVEI